VKYASVKRHKRIWPIRVVGWSMQPGMRRNLVIDALEMAPFRRRPDRNDKLIFHSDRGSQYASEDFTKVLKEYAINVVDKR
jgi:transposase InsO family protein